LCSEQVEQKGLVESGVRGWRTRSSWSWLASPCISACCSACEDAFFSFDAITKSTPSRHVQIRRLCCTTLFCRPAMTTTHGSLIHGLASQLSPELMDDPGPQRKTSATPSLLVRDCHRIWLSAGRAPEGTPQASPEDDYLAVLRPFLFSGLPMQVIYTDLGIIR
jgi:hypothetical protein